MTHHIKSLCILLLLATIASAQDAFDKTLDDAEVMTLRQFHGPYAAPTLSGIDPTPIILEDLEAYVQECRDDSQLVMEHYGIDTSAIDGLPHLRRIGYDVKYIEPTLQGFARWLRVKNPPAASKSKSGIHIDN